MNGAATGTTNFQGSFSEVIFYFTITPSLMLKGILLSIIMGAFGGLLPAITAAREPILSALRRV
jgi:putative ABC transport system permease protein